MSLLDVCSNKCSSTVDFVAPSRYNEGMTTRTVTRPQSPSAAAAERAAATVREGGTLHLGTMLSYTGGTSNKFHNSILVDTVIITNWGRIGSEGEFGIATFDTREAAAAKYWGLIRSKVGKGYLVADAVTFRLSDDITNGLIGRGTNVYETQRQMKRAVYEFVNIVNYRLVEQRRSLPYGCGPVDRSPRTPKQGASVILTITSPHPDADALLECALAASSERFLHTMVLSHPECPEEAAVARSLIELGAGLFD